LLWILANNFSAGSAVVKACPIVGFSLCCDIGVSRIEDRPDTIPRHQFLCVGIILGHAGGGD
jgi:hypothetical protein